jgi:hypothetical protein
VITHSGKQADRAGARSHHARSRRRLPSCGASGLGIGGSVIAIDVRHWRLVEIALGKAGKRKA